MARNKRRTKKSMRPFIIPQRFRRPTAPTPTPMHEMTEKQLQSRIYELEGRRAQIQKNKRPSCRKVMAEERVIQELNILRKKLEAKRKENKNARTRKD